VVLFSLVVNSVIDKGPVIFLRWGERIHGEFDAVMHPKGVNTRDVDYNNTWPINFFFNHTRVLEIVNRTYNLSPRKFLGSSIKSEYEGGFYNHSDLQGKEKWR
jgi:hypothetical protein